MKIEQKDDKVIWKESACSDPHCDYCSGRPEKPLPTK